MKYAKAAAALCLIAALTAAAPAMAKGGRAGGGRMMSPSITRTAPRPAQPARPAQPQGADRQQTARPIDQGYDPKDYGRRNAGTGQAADNSTRPQQNNGNNANQQNGTTRNNFTGGGGGFFSGFSLWPWLWFAGHGSSAASDGTDTADAESGGEESFTAMIGRWWDSVVQFFQSLFEL